MNNEVLDSIIEITGQRDTGSLEYSLVSTVAELIALDSVSLFKLVNSATKLKLEYIVHLETPADGEIEWRLDQDTIDCNKTVKQCIFSQRPQYCQEDDTDVLYMPVMGSERTVGIMRVQGAQLEQHKLLLTGLLKIYQNYLIILRESERDKLTGLLNRKTFESKLGQWGSVEPSSPAHKEWLVMIDIDHFKSVNDTYGHVCGDEILLMLSQQMRYSFPENELLFRFGGEEFVIVLQNITAEDAERQLEKFRSDVAGNKFPFVGTLTISMGYVERNERDYPVTLLDHADKALYYAKEHGRNCFYNYDHLVAQGEIEVTENDSDVELF
ncbi:MAG: GGDEF domain-containing protein [Pseudomonadales bacterium]